MYWRVIFATGSAFIPSHTKIILFFQFLHGNIIVEKVKDYEIFENTLEAFGETCIGLLIVLSQKSLDMI